MVKKTIDNIPDEVLTDVFNYLDEYSLMQAWMTQKR